MPVATVSKRTEKKELTTCPGGFVVARRMSHGEKLARLEMSGKMRVLSNKYDKDAVGEMNLMQAASTHWDFAHLIVEHNLEHQDYDQNDEPIGTPRLLNFKNPNDVDLLQSNIGEEIAAFLDSLNNYEEDKAMGNSSGASAPASSSTAPVNPT